MKYTRVLLGSMNPFGDFFFVSPNPFGDFWVRVAIYCMHSVVFRINK